MHRKKQFPSPITFITLISVVSAVYELVVLVCVLFVLFWYMTFCCLWRFWYFLVLVLQSFSSWFLYSIFKMVSILSCSKLSKLCLRVSKVVLVLINSALHTLMDSSMSFPDVSSRISFTLSYFSLHESRFIFHFSLNPLGIMLLLLHFSKNWPSIAYNFVNVCRCSIFPLRFQYCTEVLYI